MVLHRSTQASFAGGIVSRELWSRTDFTKLTSCVTDNVNMRIRPSGSVSFRSGMRFLDRAAVEDGSSKELLVPFTYTREDCGIMEFFVENNTLKMRFIKNKAVVHTMSVKTSWGSNNNYAYNSDDLAKITTAQHKNKVFICGPNLVPTYIERVSDTNWTQNFVQLGLSRTVPKPSHVGIKIQEHKNPETKVEFDKYSWGATVVFEDGTESAMLRTGSITADIELVEQPADIYVTVDWTSVPAKDRETAQVFVYRVDAGLMYFIYAIRYQDYSTKGEDGSDLSNPSGNVRVYHLTDVGFSVDKSHTEPVVLKAFRGISNTNPVFTDDTPTVCAIYKQRLVLAASKNEPNRFWLSKIGNMDDFTYRVAVTEEMAFDRELSAGDEDKIVGFVPMDDLLVGTESKIWRVTGSTASTMNAYIETYDGMRGHPLVSKKSILYLNGVSNTLNNFLYSEQQGGYVGEELDLLSKELFDGYSILDFDLQNYPVQSIYALRSDNTLKCLTYVKEQNIYGWFKIETQGSIKNICVLTGTDRDELYAIVERNGECFLECFEADFDYSDTQDTARFLDSFEEVISDGSNRIGPLTRFAGRSMTLYHRGDVKHDVQFDIEGYAELPKEMPVQAGDTIVVGYPYTGQLKTLPREIQTSNKDTVGLNRRITGSVFVRVYNTRGLKIGATENTLEEIKPYQDTEFTNSEAIPLYTGLLEATALDESSQDASVIIRQDEPLPAFIQSITTEVDYELNK